VPGAPKRLSDWAEKVLPLRDVRQLKLANTALNQDQPIAIYTPPNYDPAGEPCGLVILFDGGGFQLKSQIPAPTILDNLIRQKTIPPVVAVFVSHIHRNEELACSDASADFLVRELIPWVRKNYRVSDDPSRTIVGGMSFGGLMASYCGYRHPKVFATCCRCPGHTSGTRGTPSSVRCSPTSKPAGSRSSSSLRPDCRCAFTWPRESLKTSTRSVC
jgi:enterochelin esterase family protein